jgi:hypothetical protein
MDSELHSVNDQVIALLAHCATYDGSPMYPLAHQLFPELTELTTSMRRRAAQRPYLLADFHFGSGALWMGIRNLPAGPRAAWTSTYPRRSAVHLARAILALAWRAAEREPPERAAAKLGLAPEVAQVISTLQLTEIDQIADHHLHLLRPRWDDRPSVWRQLLRAVKTEDDEALKSCDVHMAQLVAGDLLHGIQPSPPRNPLRPVQSTGNSGLERRGQASARKAKRWNREITH